MNIFIVKTFVKTCKLTNCTNERMRIVMKLHPILFWHPARSGLSGVKIIGAKITYNFCMFCKYCELKSRRSSITIRTLNKGHKMMFKDDKFINLRSLRVEETTRFIGHKLVSQHYQSNKCIYYVFALYLFLIENIHTHTVWYSTVRRFPFSARSDVTKYQTQPLKSGGLTRASINTVSSAAPLS